jgi:hypothetical protein
MASGKTTTLYVRVFLDDSAGTVRNISGSVSSIGDVGVTYETSDVTALINDIKQYLTGRGDAPITLGGPFDNTPAAVSPALTGIHAIAPALNGKNIASTLTIQLGIRAAPTTGDPKFEGEFIVDKYSWNLDMNNAAWQMTLKPAPGTTAPAFGTV